MTTQLKDILKLSTAILALVVVGYAAQRIANRLHASGGSVSMAAN